MIAPIESRGHAPRLRNLGVVEVLEDDNSNGDTNAAEAALDATKRWVARNPTIAVVASVAAGLLVGYFVKRRGR